MNNTFKLLVVEKDQKLLENIQNFFMQKGYEVMTSEESLTAFALIDTFEPDIVITGLLLEHYDSGFILSYRIRKNYSEKKIPILVLTNVTYETGFRFSVTSKEEKEWLHCDEIIEKPVIISELYNKIEDLLRNRINQSDQYV